MENNGTYAIYAQTVDGEYEAVHGHKVVIYNQDGISECLHYSITYDAAGGVWKDGEEPAVGRCHDGESVITYDKEPTREGYRFIGWMDQDGKLCIAGHPVTESADRKMTLTAIWEKLITVTVNIEIDHNAATDAWDNEPTMHDVSFFLLREENGVNLLVEEKTLTTGYTYDDVNKITTYMAYADYLTLGPERFATGEREYTVPSDPEAYCGRLGDGIRCRAGKCSFWVTWQGDMTPCGMFPVRDSRNVFETPFQIVWEQVRKDSGDIRLPAKCAACNAKNICRACAAMVVTESGCFDKVPQYRCDMICAYKAQRNRVKEEML